MCVPYIPFVSVTRFVWNYQYVCSRIYGQIKLLEVMSLRDKLVYGMKWPMGRSFKRGSTVLAM